MAVANTVHGFAVRWEETARQRAADLDAVHGAFSAAAAQTLDKLIATQHSGYEKNMRVSYEVMEKIEGVQDRAKDRGQRGNVSRDGPCLSRVIVDEDGRRCARDGAVEGERCLARRRAPRSSRYTEC